ncbi:hypothetical protein BJ508DRAFT_309715 [Ascobolus immersus RN42]|uniref:Uncharacterized protein n=1 Tax=Ascobolus immersus RN42 TaxID=1160509 RepID=A0A3N4HXP2_ASCIM|nr:hypothetical protein BJ508DRAFT_309715 [Ascobolus immersus RN42]
MQYASLPRVIVVKCPKTSKSYGDKMTSELTDIIAAGGRDSPSAEGADEDEDDEDDDIYEKEPSKAKRRTMEILRVRSRNGLMAATSELAPTHTRDGNGWRLLQTK